MSTDVTFTVRSRPSTCPRCGLAVERNSEGRLFPHQRYAPGAGYGPNQPHDLVWCEPEGDHAADKAEEAARWNATTSPRSAR